MMHYHLHHIQSLRAFIPNHQPAFSPCLSHWVCFIGGLVAILHIEAVCGSKCMGARPLCCPWGRSPKRQRRGVCIAGCWSRGPVSGLTRLSALGALPCFFKGCFGTSIELPVLWPAQGLWPNTVWLESLGLSVEAWERL